MPTPAFISIEGSNQGNITAGAFTEDSVGNVYVEGHEDEIMAQAISHVVTVPTDPQSGQPSGQRVHQAFKFTCSLNKAVPLMYNALASGEMLPKVEITWFRTSIDGRQEEFFSTVLEDAVIVDMNLVMPNAQDPKNAPYTQLLEVSMSYRKINWDHTISGTSGSDDWRKPQV
ncbi:Hcp family type VI secretion system effector [Bisgaard Taxon 10/6]|uniref:Hcp family type VI secretion system effector n=1 Tax=Exercitatus varius TaxID=67857 RepID=A0AAW6Q796_9PAST|nr:Hcp family type VI secretion system effector [Exercitatus varius]MDG2918490.1 Hcp family type VI secretion system effector [Exercitatus varius]MDG2940383.1 Hcp family type VI secretion system effector [Exercitatus varius]MDG2942757.1 Hcp family type VI secretion system effector [Exercitatus varius]MDG2946853.1 Hcp family type VI secretion system effector [Exercitatus varius]MDG2949449.1 Hcp family type VI secretion system effector [Exercitatus varius]